MNMPFEGQFLNLATNGENSGARVKDTFKQGIVNVLLQHTLATDHRRNLPFNLAKLRDRDGLLDDFKEKNNLLYEGKYWAVTTTIGPYSNNHVMVIYSGKSQEISHIGQIPEQEMAEYYDILSTLLLGLDLSYRDRINTGCLNLFYGLNHSLNPGPGKSQSVFRPHTHIVFIDTNEKQEQFHRIQKLPIYDGEKSNKGILALNRQNLAMIKNFEKNFLDVNIQRYKESLLITQDEYYAIDFILPGKLGDSETIKIFEKVHFEGREFLEAVARGDRELITKETFDAIGDEVDKIGFSLGFYEVDGVTHLRFRFSFKNPGENAGVLEAMGHAINRDEKLGNVLPDMSEIRSHVKNILRN